MNLKHRDTCILFTFTPNPTDVSGYYDENEESTFADSKIIPIFLNSKRSILAREVTYFHELSHRECILKKCKCWKSVYWCEYHAMRGELIKSRATGSVRIRKAYIKQVKESLGKYRSNTRVWNKHLAALTRLMKTRMFREFVKGDVK